MKAQYVGNVGRRAVKITDAGRSGRAAGYARKANRSFKSNVSPESAAATGVTAGFVGGMAAPMLGSKSGRENTKFFRDKSNKKYVDQVIGKRSGFGRVVGAIDNAFEKKPRTTSLAGGLGYGAAIGVPVGVAANKSNTKTRLRAERIKATDQKKLAKSDSLSAFGVEHHEEISKIGEWKTIGQRERTQTRNRKTMRAANAAVGAGAGLVGYAAYKNPKLGQQAMGAAKHAASSFGVGRAAGGIKQGVQTAGRSLGRSVNRTPFGGTAAAGAGVIGGAAAVGAGAKGQHTYQQHKINQRRRNNAQLRKSAVSAFGVEH